MSNMTLRDHNGLSAALNVALTTQWKLMRIRQLPLCRRSVYLLCPCNSSLKGLRSATASSLKRLLQKKPQCLWMSFHLSGNHVEECSAKYFKQRSCKTVQKCQSQPSLVSQHPTRSHVLIISSLKPMWIGGNAFQTVQEYDMTTATDSGTLQLDRQPAPWFRENAWL